VRRATDTQPLVWRQPFNLNKMMEAKALCSLYSVYSSGNDRGSRRGRVYMEVFEFIVGTACVHFL